MLKPSISRPDCFAWCVLVLCLSCSLVSFLGYLSIRLSLSLSVCIVSASVCAVPGLMSYLIPQYSTYLVDTLWKLAFRSARCKSWRKCVAFKSLKSCTVDMIRNMTEPQQNDMEEQYMQSVDVYRISVDHAITVWLRVPPDVVAVPCRSHHWDSPCVACRFYVEASVLSASIWVCPEKGYAPNYGHQKWGTWW